MNHCHYNQELLRYVDGIRMPTVVPYELHLLSTAMDHLVSVSVSIQLVSMY